MSTDGAYYHSYNDRDDLSCQKQYYGIRYPSDDDFKHAGRIIIHVECRAQVAVKQLFDVYAELRHQRFVQAGCFYKPLLYLR